MLADLEDDGQPSLGTAVGAPVCLVGKIETGSVDGLTKLAKLDFLLRYPVNLGARPTGSGW